MSVAYVLCFSIFQVKVLCHDQRLKKYKKQNVDRLKLWWEWDGGAEWRYICQHNEHHILEIGSKSTFNQSTEMED